MLGGVGREPLGVDADGRQFGGDGVELGGVAGEEGDGETLLAEASGQGQAEARAGADDGDDWIHDVRYAGQGRSGSGRLSGGRRRAGLVPAGRRPRR